VVATTTTTVPIRVTIVTPIVNVVGLHTSKGQPPTRRTNPGTVAASSALCAANAAHTSQAQRRHVLTPQDGTARLSDASRNERLNGS
jgi:hypothetical protein